METGGCNDTPLSLQLSRQAPAVVDCRTMMRRGNSIRLALLGALFILVSSFVLFPPYSLLERLLIRSAASFGIQMNAVKGLRVSTRGLELHTIELQTEDVLITLHGVIALWSRDLLFSQRVDALSISEVVVTPQESTPPRARQSLLKTIYRAAEQALSFELPLRRLRVANLRSVGPAAMRGSVFMAESAGELSAEVRLQHESGSLRSTVHRSASSDLSGEIFVDGKHRLSVKLLKTTPHEIKISVQCARAENLFTFDKLDVSCGESTLIAHLSSNGNARGEVLASRLNVGPVNIGGVVGLVAEPFKERTALTFVPSLSVNTIPKSSFALSGLLDGELAFDWPPNDDSDELRGSVALKSVSGSYGSSTLHDLTAPGLRLRGNFEDDVTLIVDSFQPVAIGQLDAGIKLTEISTTPYYRFSSTGGQLEFRATSLRALGGILSSPKLSVPIGKGMCQSSTVAVSLIDLDSIAALYNSEALKAQGQLSGSLPLTLCTDGVTIEKALLRRAGSREMFLRYNPAVPPFTMQGLDVALKALQDYRVESLQAIVSLDREGDLVVNFSAAGRNPTLNKGQPINVNLNVEENVPALLKSLSVARAVERDAAAYVR